MILVTGGAGYIGSHTCLELLNDNQEVVIFDNLSNSKFKSIDMIKEIYRQEHGTECKLNFFLGDLTVEDDVKTFFELYGSSITSVIHFAGLKAVGESTEQPVDYYFNNVSGTINLLRYMKEYNVKTIIFSSSATVYGIPERNPIEETSKLSVNSPYGNTKLVIENILNDLNHSDTSWNVGILRYFNPIGAHPSGLIGEDPNGTPNNLLPFICQVAIGNRPELNVFGNDYPTADGTCIRDYVHVVDLAKGHIAALRYFDGNHKSSIFSINLGTGVGHSVLDVLRTFSSVNRVEIPYKIQPRRSGDVPFCYADTKLAKQMLNWESHLTLEDMCKDVWRWQQKNPKGY